jgi:electron transfer flavoprotein beta subunit
LAATTREYQALLKKWSEFETEEALDSYLAERGQKIPVWTVADIGVDEEKLGLAGSPTKVLKIDSIVLETTDSREVQATSVGVSSLIQDLVQDYIL